LDGRLIFIGLGEDAPPETSGEAELRFVPYQNDHRTVVLYYQACDLFIHASKAETFPNTIIEAMACGKPVIANSVGGTKEQVSERTGRLVPVGDVQAMAAGIAELLSDGDGLERLGRAAAKEARQRFDLDKQAEAYISWFKYIVESFER
jgi:glycosyltransferase involved in cell wall biosynthesis